MKSRVHLAIGYEPPTSEMRRQLWEKFLRAVPEDERDVDLEEDPYHLMREKLNGREISYMIQTARTIARSENDKLKLDHIMTVVDVRKEFDTSLKQTLSRVSTADASFKRKDSILNDEW